MRQTIQQEKAGELNLGLADMRRNPYLVNYSKARKERYKAADNGRGIRAVGENGGSYRAEQPGEKGVVERKAAEGRPVQGRSTERRLADESSTEERAMRARSAERRVMQGRSVQARPSSGRSGYTVVNGGVVRDRVNIGESYGRGSDVHRSTVRRQRIARQQARLRRTRIQRCIVLFGGIACGLVLALILHLQNGSYAAAPKSDQGNNTAVNAADAPGGKQGEKIQGIDAAAFNNHPEWTEDFLTPNEYSRPGDPLPEVKNIFVHYTANLGTSAAQNRSYFESLKDTGERSASAHFIIGYNGEIIQCIPLDEIAYAVQTRNEDSISIECCFLAENGSFTQSTYDSLISLLKWLTDIYDLDAEDILRHYDCGGKKCPLYYTENPDAWEKLKQDVKKP